MINIQGSEQKIPSFLELRRIELLKALDLDDKQVLELSSNYTPVSTCQSPEYDAAIIYSALCTIQTNLLAGLRSCIRERLIIVEDLPVNQFAAKELEIKRKIFPNYAINLQKLIKQLEHTGFKMVEKKIWKSQIPLSEDEVAVEIRILNRIALERKIDLSEELQELIAIYRISNPVFKVFAIYSFLI